MLRVGRHQEALSGLQRRGLAVPHLEERPELWPELTPFLDFFLQLDRCRPMGMGGPLALTFEGIRAGLQLRGVRPVEWEEWASFVLALDRAWLKWRYPPAEE